MPETFCSYCGKPANSPTKCDQCAKVVCGDRCGREHYKLEHRMGDVASKAGRFLTYGVVFAIVALMLTIFGGGLISVLFLQR